MEMLDVYEQSEVVLGAGPVRDNIRAVRERIELDYLKEDIPVMMRESMEGIVRVRQIVQDLKDFSRVDNFMEWQWTNLHRGIDSTLNIVSNEVKYTADVVRDYGTLPDIECLPSQLNQVIMNLIVNAAQAIGPARGTITIRTRCSEDTDDSVSIEISDTGSGISTETQARIFDPFFTTKAIGKGTGLGLSMAYGIIQKHRGQITVESVVGTGSTFRITLPIHQPATDPH
ncbi:Response Regulator Receiver Signal Transduction Histidine Kinase [Oxalobacteraceae bacterium IMCC9480]|nr:Response Regulator Receiver Signal Transduction Histidine Kinase [Oxalobacteraceae bacterium IMCC9480]